MIWTLHIQLLWGRWAEGEWAATLALDGSSTLEDLHFLILKAIGFDDDHLYSFFVARTPRSRPRVLYDEESDRLPWETTLDSLFPLPQARKLFYLFDYGDSWTFQISRSRKKPFVAEPGGAYPRLIAETGKRPEQYPCFE